MSKVKHVKVCLRTRPTSFFAQDVIKFGSDKKTVQIHIPKDKEGGFINNQQENWDFKVDTILHNASQETVFEECGSSIVKGLLEGYNGTILAYGQTGSGKTFSMTGASENYKHRGLIPRAISQIYRDVLDKTQNACTIRISYLEIYNETMIDLLASLPNSCEGETLNVVEDKNGSSSIRGLTTVIANTEEEALNYLFEGETNRSISEHQLNKNSTRSHCIFTIYLESRSRVESSERVIYSKLNLVDLAGSERLSKTQASGASLKEAMYINKSLTFLEQVIMALADKKRDHIPYRQSKLTNVLRDSLGGNCNTLLIANIWGEQAHIEETISTLRFATRMMCVSTTPIVNIQYDPAQLIRKYEREIRELKQELNMYDTISNKSHVHYEAFNDIQKLELMKTLRNFIDNDEVEIDIVNLRQIKEIFGLFKIMIKNLESDEEKLRKRESVSHSAPSVPQTTDLGVIKDIEREDGVGDVEGSGFGIGLVPSTKVSSRSAKEKRKKNPVSSKPSTVGANETSQSVGGTQLAQLLAAAHADDEEEEQQTEKTEESGGLVGNVIDEPKKQMSKSPVSRTDEFETFKKGKGADINKIFNDNKITLKEKKKIALDLAITLNETKQKIDDTRGLLDVKSNERAKGEDRDSTENIVIDQEEYILLNTMKTLKSTYRNDFESLKQIRQEIDYCSRLVDQCRQKLMTEFEVWFESCFGGNEVVVDDVVDVAEKFDKLQNERMSHEDPDSLPFYNARKTTERKKVQKAAKRPMRN